MKIIALVEFLLRLTRAFGYYPFSVSDFAISTRRVLHPLSIFIFFTFLLSIRIENANELTQLGSFASKLTINSLIALAVGYYALVPTTNLINRKCVKKMIEDIAWIDRKVMEG